LDPDIFAGNGVLISEKQQVINAEQEHEEKENPEPNVISTERFSEHFFAPLYLKFLL
jgi:hypothetical protein